ncbi:MAG: class I SAM-dependent DNA methyltransferase [Promethearchaeota archaeon]
MGKEKIVNCETITRIFGLDSDIHNEFIRYFKKKSISEKNFEKSFKKWKIAFYKIYGKNVSLELYLKHTYFTQLLKILFFHKIKLIKNLNFEDLDEKDIEIELKKYKIFEFEYFFWAPIEKQLYRKIFDKIENARFVKEDLFSEIYQQIFISEIRHKKGEFFTPLHLVKKMVGDVYEFGLKILDPSCGSGSFIVNILLKIFESQNSFSSKLKAFHQVFGFDINPLAIISTKVNISLFLLEYFKLEYIDFQKLNIYLCDSLFPDNCTNQLNKEINKLYNSFDLVIGNPPWLTYKDLFDKEYQSQIRILSDKLGIKPLSQYITHIELATIFFYAIPIKFLKKGGTIFFVMPKSVLNGDHCYKFRAFSIFNKNLEIWDFPNNYFFNVNHVCLKAQYIGPDSPITIFQKYPIKTKILNDKLELLQEIFYSSLKIEEDGAKLLLPNNQLKAINKMAKSPYKDKFFQGATLVPRTLVFFQIKEKKDGFLVVSSDPDVMSRAKKNWKYTFEDKEFEEIFHFKSFLNIDLIPFYIKSLKDVFLPINKQFDFDPLFLQKYPRAMSFYKEINTFYQRHKKETSDINTLFANLNYWDKLKKQVYTKSYLVVYNASGSNLKSAVINNKEQRVIIGSENYYYSTDSENEANFLSAIFNAPILSKNIKLVKSSRHIHKRPFIFPIPLYNKNNGLHKELAKKAKKYHTIVQDLFLNNPKINSKKVRIIINQKLIKLDKLTNQVIFE